MGKLSGDHMWWPYDPAYCPSLSRLLKDSGNIPTSWVNYEGFLRDVLGGFVDKRPRGF